MGFLGIWLFGDIANLSGTYNLHYSPTNDESDVFGFGRRSRMRFDISSLHLACLCELLQLCFKYTCHATKLCADPNGSAGALVTGIAPTATALAAYFCCSDLVLISQCLYYNTINARRAARQRAQSTDSIGSEDEPLLRRRRTSSGGGLPGSHRRPSIRAEESGLGDSIANLVTGEDETPDSNRWLHNSLSLAAVYILGTLGWFVSYKAGAWDGPEEPSDPTAVVSPVAIMGMALGYLSALCYLCARIPQIIKNYKEKSCEGQSALRQSCIR